MSMSFTNFNTGKRHFDQHRDSIEISFTPSKGRSAYMRNIASKYEKTFNNNVSESKSSITERKIKNGV